MKKILLGIIAFANLSFAEAALFDFQNAKISSDTRFNTNVELKDEIERVREQKVVKNEPDKAKLKYGEVGINNTFSVTHGIKAETKLYEFVKFNADIKYKYSLETGVSKGYKEENKTPKQSIAINDDSSIGVELDFRQYGRVGAELNKGLEFGVKYANTIKVDKLTTKLETKLQTELKQGFKHRKAKFNLDLNYDVLDYVKVFGKADLSLGMNSRTYDTKVELGTEVNKYVKSTTKLSAEYMNSNKLIIAASEDLAYEAKDVLNVKNLNITPELGLKGETSINELNGDYIKLEIYPKVSGSYEITKGLVLDSMLGVNVRFLDVTTLMNTKSHPSFVASGLHFRGVDPVLKFGLTYKLN